MKKASMKLPGSDVLIPALILLLILLFSVAAPVISPYDPIRVDMQSCLRPPSSRHFLGTDVLGRDVFSRILYGGRISILVAMAATALSMLLGFIIGVVSGYFGGRIDGIVFVVTNMFQGLPGTSLMIAVAGVLGPGVKSLVLALVLTSWTDFSRVVRGEVLKLREENYVEGVKSIGASSVYIIFRHILPNMMGTIIVLFTAKIGRVILSIAALSFIGLGLQPPAPDWGVMISDARDYFRSFPHLIVAPGLCILMLALSINLLGDALRDRSYNEENKS